MVLENGSALASEALNYWLVKNYSKAVETLRELRNEIENETKILASTKGEGKETEGESDEASLLTATEAKLKHNLAVAVFAKDGGTTRLLDELKEIYLTYYKTRSDQKSSNKSRDGEDEDTEENHKGHFELDASLVLYNQAVVLVHLQRYKSAIQILQGLFRYIEAVDENVALCICFLLLDLYSGNTTNMSDTNAALLKAHEIIDFLEKPHGFNGSEPGLPDDVGNETEENGGKESKGSSRQVSEFKFRLHMYKAKLRMLESNVKGSRKEVKSALEIFQHELKTFPQNAEGLWLGLQLDKFKEKSNIKVAVDELDQSFNTPALCLKANLEYLRSNHRKSIKLLQSCSKAGLEKGKYFNNMGCIHHSLGQHQCALMYFAKSLEYYQIQKPEGIPRPFLFDVYLNLGVQLLHSRQPRLAYSCFLEAAMSNYHRPKLWMYIAQCVVLVNEEAYNSKRGDINRIHRTTKGIGVYRRFRIDVGGSYGGKQVWSRQCASDFECSDQYLPGAQQHKQLVLDQQKGGQDGLEGMKNLSPLSLETGLRATTNALYLLETLHPGGIAAQAESTQDLEGASKANEKKQSKTATEDGNGDDSDGDAEDKYTSGGNLLSIAITTLLCRAYLALWLSDFSIAISSSSRALKLLATQHSLTPMQLKQQSIAHTYLTEAYLRTGDTSSGLDHASKALKIVEDSLKQKDSSNLSESQLLRCKMCINVATARISQGNYKEAERIIQKALQIVPKYPIAYRLLLFIYVKTNSINKALSILKHNS